MCKIPPKHVLECRETDNIQTILATSYSCLAWRLGLAALLLAYLRRLASICACAGRSRRVQEIPKTQNLWSPLAAVLLEEVVVNRANEEYSVLRGQIRLRVQALGNGNDYTMLTLVEGSEQIMHMQSNWNL